MRWARFWLGIGLLPGAACAQSVCPSIDFLLARTVSLTRNLGSGISFHTNVVRQADGSYTGFEIEVSDSVQYAVISTTPHFERQFANCLPHTLPATPSPAGLPSAAISSPTSHRLRTVTFRELLCSQASMEARIRPARRRPTLFRSVRSQDESYLRRPASPRPSIRVSSPWRWPI